MGFTAKRPYFFQLIKSKKSMRYTSRLEISAEAYRQNLQFIRSWIGLKPEISAVVKGNAYGHGISQLVRIAEQAGVRHFSTFSSDEAWQVKAASENSSTVMIMGMLHLEELPKLIEAGIEFFVFDFHRLEAAILAAKSTGTSARVHLEVETGFHRTGFAESDFEKLSDILLQNQDHLEIKGLCTHFAGAESAQNHTRVRHQIERFQAAKAYFESLSIQPEKIHSACSAATLLFPETHFDLVRIGILGYGFWPTRETFDLIKNQIGPDQNPLRRLLTWKSELMSLKPVRKGEFVGYGKSFQATEDMTLGIIPVGYSHGYGRNLSNQGQVLIHGIFCPVIGTVNMNAIAVDVSLLTQPQPGDEVILIGNQGENEITVASFAETSHLVNYEMLTRLPCEIPRRVVD